MWARVRSDRLYLEVWKEIHPAVPVVTGTAGHARYLFPFQHHGLLAVFGTCLLLISASPHAVPGPQTLPWPLRPAGLPLTPVTMTPARRDTFLYSTSTFGILLLPYLSLFFMAFLSAQCKPPVSPQLYLVCLSPAGPRGPAPLSRLGQDEGRKCVKASALGKIQNC